MTTSDEMGAFCHDHIQHPLMWCDEKKRLVERKNAEESLRMWRRRKAEECARKEKDKQEVSKLPRLNKMLLVNLVCTQCCDLGSLRRVGT